jgi:hypothetical protein
VQKERSGRIRRCSLDVGPILDIVAWLNRYSDYWQGQFAQLTASLEQGERSRARVPNGLSAARATREKPRALRAERRATKKAR